MASPDRHYHPAIYSHLSALLPTRDWKGVPRYLSTLSHSQFRTAGYILGERLMPPLPTADFWALARELYLYASKAFLVTVLKCSVLRGVETTSEGYISFLSTLRTTGTGEDVRKTLLTLLPALGSPQDITALFDSLALRDAESRLPYLLRVPTDASSYVLLLTLRTLDHDRGLLVRTVNYVMKRGDDRSFNLASLLKTYFGLDEIGGTFSRPVAPYELSRLAEGGYEAFRQALNR